jgi:hypothetical protein
MKEIIEGLEKMEQLLKERQQIMEEIIRIIDRSKQS